MAGICSTHHVLRIPHLLRQLGDRERAVLLGASSREGGKAHHEKMKSRKGDQVDGEFPQIGVELSGESQAAGDSAHCSGYQMVEIPNWVFMI